MTAKTKIAIVDLSTTKPDPIVRRRIQCISKLEDQQKLLADASYTRTIVRWKGKGAARKSTEKKLPVRAWWTQQLNGVSMRLRFIAGKQGVVVGTIAELPAVIGTLIEEIRSGELDALITPVKKEKKLPDVSKAKPITTPIKVGTSPARRSSS